MKKACLQKHLVRYADGRIPAGLVRAVVKQIGGWESFRESARDVSRHGADGGFHGFIYYAETFDFTRKNKKHILEMAKQDAESFGEKTIYGMFLGFGCIKNNDITAEEIALSLYGGRVDRDVKDLVFNCLAWYALEEVARAYDDMAEGN